MKSLQLRVFAYTSKVLCKVCTLGLQIWPLHSTTFHSGQAQLFFLIWKRYLTLTLDLGFRRAIRVFFQTPCFTLLGRDPGLFKWESKRSNPLSWLRQSLRNSFSYTPDLIPTAVEPCFRCYIQESKPKPFYLASIRWLCPIHKIGIWTTAPAAKADIQPTETQFKANSATAKISSALPLRRTPGSRSCWITWFPVWRDQRRQWKQDP